MSEWKKFNENLFKVKDIFEYNSTIENKTLNLLEEIFPNSKIQLEQELVQKYFYDFSIEMSDFKLFCEVKREKTALIKFWKNNISLLSDEIKNQNLKKGRKHTKYLLILIDSDDSLAKMELSPIYYDVLVINIKILFQLQKLISNEAEDIKIFIKNIFREASGVLYDNFIDNIIDLVKSIDIPDNQINIDNFLINQDILKLDIRKLFNVSIKLFSRNEIELLSKFLTNYYKFDSYESLKVFRKNNKTTERLQKVLANSNNVIYSHQLKEIGFNNIEINRLNKIFNSINLKYEFIDRKKCQIVILLSISNLHLDIFNEYIINPLKEEGFNIQIFTYESNLNEIIEMVSKSNIAIMDLTEEDPIEFYLIGLFQKYTTKFIILTSEEQEINFLKNENFLVFNQVFSDPEHFRESFLELVMRICAKNNY